MANQNTISPAVRSLQNEQSDQERRGTEGDLDKALKDTFPASDPVAMSSTTGPSDHVGGSGSSRSARAPRTERVTSEVKGSIDGYVADLEARIREKPLAAAAIVAGLAWLYGRTR